MMISHDKESLAGGDLEKVSPKTLTWRRVLKVTLSLALIIALCGGAFVGVLFFRYHRIVSARPGKLHTQVRPAEIGRRVNPFIGTGGFPWVCGHNFPGAMVPFGMVRLGPETASILRHKRALNTSGYYYGDDQILGFSHTRLNGTGATDGGQFLVMPTRDFVEPHCCASGNPRPSRTARSWPRPVTTLSGCRSQACSSNSRPPRVSVSTAIRLATEKLRI